MKQQLKETSISKDSLEIYPKAGEWIYKKNGFSISIGNKSNSPNRMHDYHVCTIDDNSIQAENNAKAICEAVNNYNALKDIAKQVHFWFSNEANYPEGTNGYRIKKQIESILPELKQL